jgi:hypothetical protein
MSVKERMDLDAKRQAEDIARNAAPKTVIKPEEDVALKAALEKVASGRLVAAFRTRNGALLTTRAPGGKLHPLQKQNDDVSDDE